MINSDKNKVTRVNNWTSTEYDQLVLRSLEVKIGYGSPNPYSFNDVQNALNTDFLTKLFIFSGTLEELQRIDGSVQRVHFPWDNEDPFKRPTVSFGPYEPYYDMRHGKNFRFGYYLNQPISQMLSRKVVGVFGTKKDETEDGLRYRGFPYTVDEVQPR